MALGGGLHRALPAGERWPRPFCGSVRGADPRTRAQRRADGPSVPLCYFAVVQQRRQHMPSGTVAGERHTGASRSSPIPFSRPARPSALLSARSLRCCEDNTCLPAFPTPFEPPAPPHRPSPTRRRPHRLAPWHSPRLQSVCAEPRPAPAHTLPRPPPCRGEPARVSAWRCCVVKDVTGRVRCLCPL